MHAAESYPEQIIVYDGECKLCNGFINFILARDKNEKFVFCPAQSVLGTEMMMAAGFNDTGDALKDYLSVLLVKNWGSQRTQILQKSRAFFSVMSDLGWPNTLWGLFRVVPESLRDWCYDYIAKNRYRFFGRYDVCQIPDPKLAHRFIE